VILDEGCSIRYIEDLYPTSKTEPAFTHYIHTWTKLRAFELVDICDKCVFMDADIIVLKNMDEIFDLDNNINFGAVQTCTCNLRKLPTFPKFWKKENCPYTYGLNSNNITHNNPHVHITFNSGVFLFHPNLTIFQQMLEALNTWDLSAFVFPDQDFLNKFYDKKWTRLPFMYNGVKVFSISHPYLWDLSNIKTIHYVLGKPWKKSDENSNEYEEINQLWWQAYHWKSETK
jgi:alpha-N-acetylglucosamine transferase